VRTWDVGGDALGPAGAPSPNPALGERALRLIDRAEEPFRVQLRALLRAGAHGPVRIMFPFVSGPEDLRRALSLLEQAKRELRAEGATFDEEIAVGVNVEVPSAAVVADLLADEVDFFSVGTNDLIQYLLAVDRTDPRVSALYDPWHPAVLRTLDGIVRSADAAGRPLSVCGEMAADPLQAVLLVGLGYRSLSMAPSAIPRVKEAIRAVSASVAAALAHRCLGLGSGAEIEAAARGALPELAKRGA
jgi:phosphoenolpyruvate-protein phosphotransferase (PTS system enzyme I)